MALEQITGEVVTEDQDKNQPAPNSKLAAMKKKVKTMDTELRSKVPVKQVQKEDEDFVTAMQDQYKNRPADAGKENNKSKLLTPERTMEVADSLSKEGVLKLTSLVGFRKDKEKAGTYANKYMSDKFLDSLDNDANKDISNAVRYRSLALKAMNKNK